MVKLFSFLALMLAATSATPAGATAIVAGHPTNRAPAQKYCLRMDPGTGSRIKRSDCRTKAEWKDLGIDVDELLSRTGSPDPSRG